MSDSNSVVESPSPGNDPSSAPVVGKWRARADDIRVAIAFVFLAIAPWVMLATGIGKVHNKTLLLFFVGAIVVLCVLYIIVAMLLATRPDEQLLIGRAMRPLAIWALAVSGLLGGFATIYSVVWGSSTAFNPQIGRISAALYTVGTFATTGSGISAKESGAQLLTILQIALDFFAVFVALTYLVTNFRNNATKRTGGKGIK